MQHLVHHFALGLSERADSCILHLNEDCIMREIHLLPAFPFSKTRSGMMKVSFLYAGTKRYGTGLNSISSSSPSLVLLLKSGRCIKELREALAELEWYIFLSCFTFVVSTQSRLLFCYMICRRRVLTCWVEMRVLDSCRRFESMMQKS